MQKKQYHFTTQDRSVLKQVRFDDIDIACVLESKLSMHVYAWLKVWNKIEHILLHYKSFNGCNEHTICKGVYISLLLKFVWCMVWFFGVVILKAKASLNF